MYNIYILYLICGNSYTHRSIFESLCYFLSASVPGSHSPRFPPEISQEPSGAVQLEMLTATVWETL